MKDLFYRLCRVILTLLGFSAASGCAVEYGCPPVYCEYGVPTMEFIVTGKVTDSETENPVKGIAVTYIQHNEWERSDTVWTDEDGRFLYESYDFPSDNPKFKFTDVDGEENGGDYETKVVTVPVTQTAPGDGNWDNGDYSGELDVTLNAK